MANYTQKLANMRSRRLGLDAATALTKDSRFIEAATFSEAYETRAKTDAVKYAIGAMQELEAKYTQICYEEGDRVRKQLNDGLKAAGIPATYDYQGSVPLNIHIRFASDIDLLVLHDRFVTVDWAGPKASTYSRLGRSSMEDMLVLRQQCESILASRFPAVKVDKTGAKSIALSGGSLQRKVDVVPSHWHDTTAYQISNQKHDREVKILDKSVPELVTNRPFQHMRQIANKDTVTNGGAKKMIRLLKNLRKDSPKNIDLNSYEIAALVWHFDDDKLTKPYFLELSLVAEAQRSLQWLVDYPALTKTLDVPDGSRKIIDAPEKMVALQLLKAEVDELATALVQELNPIYAANRDLVRKSLMEVEIF